MTYNEFVERTNYYPTLDEFSNYINELYMESEDDKDTFCKKFIKNHLGASSRRMTYKINELNTMYDRQVRYTEELDQKNNELLKGLRESKDREIASLKATIEELQNKLYSITHIINA